MDVYITLLLKVIALELRNHYYSFENEKFNLESTYPGDKELHLKLL